MITSIDRVKVLLVTVLAIAGLSSCNDTSFSVSELGQQELDKLNPQSSPTPTPSTTPTKPPSCPVVDCPVPPADCHYVDPIVLNGCPVTCGTLSCPPVLPPPSPKPSPSATPSPTPSTSPSTTPSTTPSVTPSPSPTPSTMPTPTPSPSLLVCDPFGGGKTAGSKNGLEAQLTYIPATSPVVKNSSLTTDAFTPGNTDVVVSPAQIFLSQVNTSTTLFSQGFKDSKGTALTDTKGNTLIEWFSLRTQGQVMLNAKDVEGDYQFAILSDDGSLMKIDRTGTGSSFETWIDNDHTQGNTLGCAANTVHLKPSMSLPIQIRYFQGPRYRIAFMLLWRKNPTSLKDSECGVHEGDDYFFSSSSGTSTATSAYNKLLSRGWSVVPAENLYLNGDKVNPCADVYPEIPSESDMLDKYGCGNRADKTVYVCKVPPGNPAARHEICVALEGAVNGQQVPVDGSVGPTGNYLGKCK